MFVFPAGAFAAASGGGGGGATTTWNPSDKSAQITLTNGNLTAATTGSGSDNLVRSTTSQTTGKLYFEETFGSTGSETAIGLANSTASLTAFLGTDNNGIGIYQSGHIFRNGSNVLSGPSFTTGDVIGVAIDFGAGLIWFRNNSSPSTWNGGGSADPATGVGGLSLSAITGPFFACCDTFSSGHPQTANFGQSGFGQTPPTGYSMWG